MMKILIISQNYPPDLGAGAFRIKSLVDALIARGHEITVLTGTPNRYHTLHKGLKFKKTKETIIRVRIPRQKRDFLRRSINYWFFYHKATRVGKKIADSVDGILATTPQLLVAYVGATIAKKSKKPFILDVRDLWPDVLLDLGIAKPSSIIYKALKKIEKTCYEQTKQIVINSPGFYQPILEFSNKKPIVITNGIEDTFFDKLATMGTRKPGPKPFRILYAGNIGIAQDLSILLSVAKAFQDTFIFELVGDGSDRNQLYQAIKENGIKNIMLSPPVDRVELFEKYRNTDAFFIHLKNVSMFEKTIPSKLFEYVATGKLVVYGLSGVSKQIMEELKQVDFPFESGNAPSLTLALNHLQRKLEEGALFDSISGRVALREKYLRSKLNIKFAEIIERTINCVD